MKSDEYMGQMLWVNLDDGKIKNKIISSDDLEKFIGGRGLGIKLLTDLAPQGVEPLSPDNPLIITTGPYTGVGVFSAFFSVTTKAPLTGIAASSHCGGHFGPKLRRAGIDGIIITGAAKTPYYLMIDEKNVSLKSADDIWGKGTLDTTKVIQEREGNVEILTIGPAGENKVRYATMMNGHRAAGRSGVGAVMGSKGLKAIAVKGNLPIHTAFPDTVTQISRKGSKLSVEGAIPFAKYGSSNAFEVFNEANTLPTKNFRGGHFENSDKINADALKNNYFVKDRGCFKCPLRCGNIHTVKEGPYQLKEVEGPEYETMMSFGSNCNNDNLESILKANFLCNDLGIDTISCGNTFALLMDLYELGIIGDQDLDGHSMKWGEHTSIISLIPKIAVRDGIGDLIAEGSYRLAKKFGTNALERVIHAKKQEYPGFGSRRSFGTGMSLTTSNRGACHLRSMLYVNEIFTGEFDKDGFEANMETLLDKEHLMAIADTFLTCKFGMRSAQFTWPVLTELINALTGSDRTEDDLKRVGERIWNLERIYNLREGVGEDIAPQRFFKEDLDDGKNGGKAIDKERFVRARSLYYSARGWDANGVPTKQKLEMLKIRTCF